MCSCVERSEEVQDVSNTNHSSTLQFVGFPALLLPSAGWKVLLRTLRTASLSSDDNGDNVANFVL